ncbi:MAG TPA: hypothetical protein PLQ89_05695 [Phycisphaerae bacterium]|nr:hypothetical protein [Phycisphaerae bacterium]HOQ85195.1 hypothetical protein [Phycisphaerae bacterium]HPU27419.1 hypothetical protein [Phycisphaerae bacterium]
MHKSIALLLSVVVQVPVVPAAAPTFQDLMKPECLPHAQLGMRVETARIDGQSLTIETRGAQFSYDLAGNTGVLRQKIGTPRELVRLRITGGSTAPQPATSGDCKLTHRGPGLAFATFATPRFDLRANGDSLFMLHAREPLRLELDRCIEPGFVASYRSNHVIFDEYGGFGLYCSVPDIHDNFDPYGVAAATRPADMGETSLPVRVATYDLPADAVVWIAICPPKPYDWVRSTTDHVVWHWSNTLAYPPDDVLASWAKFGNIILLQSEVMLWKDWNLAFEPRLGPAEFARVRDTVHRLGMRFIVYTSPHYFLRGTAKQSAAMNSFENFTHWPSGTSTGENIELFLAEITKVMREYRPDGLYFDGQYDANPAALYLLARRAREIVGERGILEWHSTQALGPDLCSLPTADAYVDFILRGEGRDLLHDDEDYLRYFVSGYNVHNSIGVLCNNTRRSTPEILERLVDVNGRTHTLAGWLDDPKLVELVTGYRRQLADVDRLRDRVHVRLERRQAEIPGQVRTLRQEEFSLRNEPGWSEPVMHLRFDSLAGRKLVVSPLNPDPLSVQGGVLEIRARAHTYAFVEEPVERQLRGCVVKLRRGSDQGMSWGPGVCLYWPGDRFLRVGLRSDGLVQADISGDQRLVGRTEPDEWVWLRVRWGEQAGVLEQSGDGRNFTRIMDFQHAGRFLRQVSRIAVGKVPYNGVAQDYSEPGPVGSSAVAEVRLY